MRNSFLLFLAVFTTLTACRTPEQVTVIKTEPAAPAPIPMRTWSGRLAEAGLTTWQYGTHTLTGVEFQDTIVRPVKSVLFAVKSNNISLNSFNGKDVVLTGYYVDGYPVDGGPPLIEVVAVREDVAPYKKLICDCPEYLVDSSPALNDISFDPVPPARPYLYYIYDGKRREVSEFDNNWLRENCTIRVVRKPE